MLKILLDREEEGRAMLSNFVLFWLRHEPKIKCPAKENSTKSSLPNPSRALKRMRDSTLTLRSLDNIMPSPVKRVKSCREKCSAQQQQQQQQQQQTQGQDGGGGGIDTKDDPLVKNRFTKVISFARGFSPRRSNRRKKSEVDLMMQRSSSLRVPLSKSPEPPAITNTQQQIPQQQQQQQQPHPKVSQRNSRTRGSQLWLESLAHLDEVDCWTPQQIKRQEAIYELYCGETDLVEDINLLQEVYFNPLTELKLLRGEDLSTIFGTIRSLLPLHQDLVRSLEAVRAENGSIDQVGEILLKWIPTLRPYIDYCAKQLEIKEILFHISKDKQVSDFFQRCLEDPSSRKLDLWSFLDSPRSKLVKYPLLVTNIHKYTPKDHPDRTVLEKSLKELESLIKEADRKTGISKCTFYKEKLSLVEEEVYKKAFDQATSLVCNGCLKNKGGSKIHAFLFDTIFLCARTTTRNGNKVYIVNTKPILVADMYITDLGDGEVRLGGSFRTTLSKGTAARHAIRVSGKSIEVGGKSIILQANDQHDKKQWLGAFQSLLGVPAIRTYRQDNTLNNQLKPTTGSNEPINDITISTPSTSSSSEIPCIS